MTDLVPTDQIEQQVGTLRNATHHIARANSAEETVYILHGRNCLDSGIDLRECEYSIALDQGIDPDDWYDHEDQPVYVKVDDGLLKPDLDLALPPSVREQQEDGQ
jgi:hypothetical protein